MRIQPPRNPIEAATHPDPYPYYADLVACRSLYWDETIKCWIASSAETVTAILTNKLCRVRPPAEIVPAALLNSPVADIFRHLVRMNDGQQQHCLKGVVASTLQAMNSDTILAQSKTWARLLTDEMKPESDPGRLAEFAFRLPVYVVASLLGIPETQLLQTSLWMSDFVRCLAPGSLPQQIEQGKEAASHLLDLLHTVVRLQEAEDTSSGLRLLIHDIKQAGYPDRAMAIANGIGLLSQAYEATAGLIGNTLLTLARRQEVSEQLLADPNLLPLVIEEVLRYDPPIQNTRRYVAFNGTVAGGEMKEGDGVLVVLAAANRDPDVNHNPERFDLFRPARRLFTFGVGEHACPGEMMAVIIARTGVEQLIHSGVTMSHLAESVSYRSSANTRIPLFEGGKR